MDIRSIVDEPQGYTTISMSTVVSWDKLSCESLGYFLEYITCMDAGMVVIEPDELLS